MIKAVRGVVTAIKSLPLEVKQSPPTQEGSQIQGDCFVAGTKVRTENGYKKIEEIEVGEKVLAYDEKTGRQEYKRVVRLFRGETNEWYHIEVNGEEIRCTGNHPFYVKGKGYVKAKELTREDKLVLSDGKEVGTEGIRIERLEKPETKYNFEVEDFHTYYVTESEILVHNKCKPVSPVKLSKNEIKKIDAENYKRIYIGNKGSRFDIFKDTANKDKIWLGDKQQRKWIETFESLQDLFKGDW